MDTQYSPQSAKTIGILHPGQMGITIAIGLKHEMEEYGPHQIIWASSGRSQNTEDRADRLGLIDVFEVDILLQQADVVFCILRGGSMLEYAQKAVDSGFAGIWVDANGMWGKESEEELAQIFDNSEADYVEAGLYGWPWPGKQGYTEERTMYLSGERAIDVANLFVNDYWQVEIHETSAKEVKRLRNDREIDPEKV